MPTGLQHLMDSLGQRDLITPYFEAAVLADNWPDHYTVTIDSSPYYGLNEDGTPDGYFHPSTHSLLGERELYYRMHPDTAPHMVWERPSLQREMGFAMGSALHGVIQTQMQMCGLVRGPEDIEVEYINVEHHVRGRIDWITHLPNNPTPVVVELKTRNSRAYRFQQEPELSWLAQLNLALDSQNIDLGVLLMVESGWPYKVREFKVRRDPELLASTYAKFDRVRAAIEKGVPPRACCALNSPTMKDCGARFMCWLSKDPEMRPGG